MPGKDTEALEASMCVWTHEAREAENSALHQLPLRLQTGLNQLSCFLSATSGSSSVSMKAEKMRLDSRRCLQKTASGRDVKVPQTLPAQPCRLFSPPPPTQDLRTQPQETLPFPPADLTVAPSLATSFPCSGPHHADFALNSVYLFAPGCLCAQRATSLSGWSGEPDCSAGLAASTHRQLLIRDLKSFPRFYESIYVYH